MMTKALIVIATANDLIEAAVLRGRLESAGIQAFLLDEGIVAAHGLLTNAVGGIKIQVEQTDAERALVIVQEQRQPRTATKSKKVNTGWGVCPKCSGKNLKPFREALGWKGVLLLFGLMIFRPKRKLQCNSCDYCWDYSSAEAQFSAN
ncbi:MAG: DUF2007 domain-containing protein [Pyrinomonadaceae bacterium]